jgi:hypothetical protein
MWDWLTKGTVVTAFLFILGYLFRGWLGEILKRTIQIRFDKDLEAYRVQLKSVSDKDLERLKDELSPSAKWNA